MDVLVLGTAAVVVCLALVATAALLARWHRNHFRFTTRALLIAFAVCGCLLFLWIQYIAPIFRHRLAIQRIAAAGGNVDFLQDYELNGNRYDQSKRGANQWREVASVNIAGDHEAFILSDELQHLPETEQIRMFGITDAGVRTVVTAVANSKVTQLDFHEATLTSKGTAAFAGAKDARSLFFNTCNIDNDAWGNLKSMPSLTDLWILEEGKTSNPDRVSDAGFAKIGQLEKLEGLRLTNLNISDAAAEQLHGLTNLKKVFVTYCRISDQAVADLRAALPDCEIQVHETRR